MKKLLAFLVLLAVGIGILRLLQGPPPKGVDAGGTHEPWTPEVGTETPGLTPGGALVVRQLLPGDDLGRRPVRLVLRAEDSGAGADPEELVFRGVDLRYLDPETREARLELTAARARARRAGATLGLELPIEPLLHLEDVELTLREGAPVVPLTLNVPRLALDLEARTIASEERVKLGQGLAGGGRGLLVDQVQKLLRLDADAELDLGGLRPGAALSSAGPLVVRRDPAGSPNALLVEAREAAHLEPGGSDEEDLEPGLDADRIVLRGHREGAGAIRFQSIEAEGGVRYRHGRHALEGGQLVVTMAADGSPESARLSRGPRATLDLGAGLLDLDLPVPAPEDGRAVVTSEGDLELEWEPDRVRVLADGPARVDGAGSVLDSEGPLTGWIDADGASAHFAGTGGVRLAREGAVLATRELSADLERLADGRTRLFAVADGRPLITGEGGEGRGYVLSAEGALEFEQIGAVWRIPKAERVELTVLGPDGFRARADRLESFDPEALQSSDPEAVALVAHGGIQVETAQGTATGETLRVMGPERFVLEGTPQRRAAFESAEGRAEAATITGAGETVVLEGEVVGRFAPSVRAGEDYSLACRRLELQRRLEEEAGAAGARSFRMEARDVSEARLKGLGDELELACAELDASFREVLDQDGRARERHANALARGVERAVVRREEADLVAHLACQTLAAWRTERAAPDPAAPPTVEGLVSAEGGVAFGGSAGEVPFEFEGLAERVTIDQDGELRAYAREGARVRLSGVLASSGRPFELEADSVRASRNGLEAERPQILVYRTPEDSGERVVDLRARADRMVTSETWVELVGAVRVDGVTEQASPWRVEAGHVRFEGHVADPESGARSEVSEMLASRGVVLTLPRRALRATAETLHADRLSGLMRLEGVPARLESPEAVDEAEWIEIDVNLGFPVGSGRGRTRSGDDGESAQDDGQGAGSPWRIEYLSRRALIEPDAFIFVLQEPRIVYEGPELQVFLPVLPTNRVELRASWAVFWVDRNEWDKMTELLEDQPALGPAEAEQVEAAPPSKGLFGRLRQFGIINEVYLEGPVEVRIQDQPNATASAVYLDVVSGNGWLADVVFTVTGELVGRDFSAIKVSADWLRQSNDDSFYADEATVSLCEFEDPHVEITTGDLRIAPNEYDPRHYDIRLKDNRIRMFHFLRLPLPSIDFSTNERGSPILETLRLGNSARFGSFVSAGFARPAEGAANFFRRILSRPRSAIDLPDVTVPDVDVEAQYHVDASWLGSRGVLLDFGFEVEAEDQFRWLTELGGVPDSDDDKGYVRVPEDDRDSLRLWLRSRGRYWFSERTWLDIVGTYQSDAGVQSEFFESDFTRYELQESYLRARTARGSNYLAATVTGRANDFFSSVDEQPSLAAWHGRGEVLALGPTSLVYAADAQAAHLERRESDGGYASPFGLPPTFADGLGDREVTRFDTAHRLEAPTPLGFLGLRATPFVVGRFTAWSEDAFDEDEPSRAFGQVGARLSMPLWKEAADGGVHQLVPYVEAREDVVLEESGGDPVAFDEVESTLEGRFVDVGVRGRVRASGAMPLLDLDLRATHVDDVPDAPFEGWNEFGVFARLSTDVFDMPVQLTHDGRYDFEEGDTLYSRIALGLRPTDALGLEAAHYRGLDLDREPLFEAATIAGIYTWTPKWEFEGRQTFSLLDDGDRLGSGVVVRRYGHDLVFEIETSYRQGEGTSFGINVRPLFNFDRPEVGEISF